MSSIRQPSVFGLMPTEVPLVKIWLPSMADFNAVLSARSSRVTLQSVRSLIRSTRDWSLGKRNP